MSSQTGAEHRGMERLSSRSLRIMMDGEEVPVVDISGTGVLIDGGEDWIVPGQGIHFKFVITIGEMDKLIPAYGTVIRVEDRGIAVHYQSPHPEWGRILTDYLKSTR